MELDAVVLKAVAPNPNSRLQSAALLAAELRATVALLDSRGINEEDERPTAPVGGFPWMLGVVILLALVAAWWFVAR
jgi:hypothetical protein